VRREEELRAIVERFGTAAIAVPDTLASLQTLARFHMRWLASAQDSKVPTRIGVTGSNGKTTTKEIIGKILSSAAPTVVNEGNLNSEIGLPIACFAVRPTHRYAVFEMGMNRRGEMDILADIVRPDLALITNIGSAHIGLLGSRAEIAKEKRKVFAHFDGRQTAFLPESEEFFPLLSEGLRGKIVRFGPSSTLGFTGSESKGLDGTIIHWEGSRIRFPLFGPYNLANALGAISVARELGVPNAEIRDGLEAVAPLFGRSQIITGRVTVAVDCYNANPDSMDRAVSFIGALPWEGRKIVVLGAMRELGEQTAEAHRALGESLRTAPFHAVFLFGPEMESAWKALAGAPAADRVRWLTDMESLGEQLGALLSDGDLVLLKGSRGLELEKVLPRIMGDVARSDRQGPGC
jgi:UDP-N-acetylmuramoyl-tripeptide--D-alanyl-D-alanine ligase